MCDDALMGFENWTQSVHMLCKQCSEGTPHETHDEDLENKNFDQELNFAIAAKSRSELEAVLYKWKKNNNGVRINWID